MERVNIGKRIKECRIAAGMTQMQLAEALDLSPNHVSAMERGAKIPKLETFVKLINLLGVSSDTLLGDVLHYSRNAWANQLDPRIAKLDQVKFQFLLEMVDVFLNNMVDNC